MNSTLENAVIGSATLLTVLAILFAKVAVVGWLLMLTCGAIWHEFDALAPIGYWAAFLFSVPIVALSWLLSNSRPGA